MKQIGYIGLGKMGFGMVEHLLEKGWSVTANNRSAASVDKIAVIGAKPAYTVQELVQALPAPRLIWLMVSHQAVDIIIEELVPLLQAGDTIIDGGNSNFQESMRRAKELEVKNIAFMDAGVSGGPSGARNGACVMVGGSAEKFKAYEELFKDISLPDGYAYFGPAGAGHFVKMVHNGIEYGMMQAIGEGFALLKKSPFNLDLAKVAELYNNGSVISSRLVGWLKQAYDEHGLDLADVSGKVAASGEGQWTVETAKKWGVPVEIIERSLHFRTESQKKPSYIGQVVSALRNQFGHHDVSK